jgi:UDP-2,3-diacylglucosamine hydrolase
MRLIVLSDLHIKTSEDLAHRALLNLMEKELRQGDVFVLAGDIFDLFVGDKKLFRNHYRSFFDRLSELGDRRIETHYIEGNHDFQLEKVIDRIPGVSLHSHSVRLHLKGKRFFIAHGDTVDKEDYGYRLLRSAFRSLPFKTVVSLMPGQLIHSIGSRASEKSRVNPKKVDLQSLRKIYRNYAAEKLKEGYDFVVLGHCHDLDEMKFKLGERQGQYINVGFPPSHGTFLMWTPDEGEVMRKPFFK